MQRMHPIMSGTQAPSGTFLNEAPQKSPVHQSYESLVWRKKERPTIKEPKYDKVYDTDNYGPMFHILYLNGNHHAGCEHDSRDGKTVSVRQIGQIGENGDKNDGKYHKRPVGCGDINLSLDGLGGVEHAKRGECLGVYDLLNQRECGGDHCL